MKYTIFVDLDAFVTEKPPILPIVKSCLSTFNAFETQDGSRINLLLVSNFKETKGFEEANSSISNLKYIFITSNLKHAHSAKRAGMKVLFRGKTFKYPAFKLWPEALIWIALMTEFEGSKNLELALRTLVQTDKVGEFYIAKRLPNRIEAHGKYWKILNDSKLEELQGINVQIPISLTLTIPKIGFISIEKEDNSDTEHEVISHVRSLKAHGRIEDINPSPIGSPTHFVETDKAGIRMLKRRNFN